MLIPLSQPDKICWCSSKKVTWDDFWSSENTTKNENLSASISTSLLVESKILAGTFPEFTIKPMMNRKKSWASEKKTDYLLEHEQLHFDITELSARKLRSELDELREQGVKDVDRYDELVHHYLSWKDSVNKVYDSETYHSVYEKKQSEWNKKIAKQLKELEEYATTSKDCE